MTTAGHRRSLRHQPVPTRPRRISGPARGRAAAAPAPTVHERAARALALIRSLPEHSLLDRLVRGRAWIPVLGVLLAGIVAMQVEVLKLNTSVGRWMQRSSTLQTKNESLQVSVASLADDQRIERLAAGMGMVMPAPTTISFLPAYAKNAISHALSNIHAPDPAGFIVNLPAATPATTTASSALTTGTGSATSSPSLAGTQAQSTTPSASSTPQTTTPATGATAQGTATAAPPATAPASQTAPAPAAPTQGPATGAAALAPTGTSAGNATTGG